MHSILEGVTDSLVSCSRTSPRFSFGFLLSCLVFCVHHSKSSSYCINPPEMAGLWCSRYQGTLTFGRLEGVSEWIISSTFGMLDFFAIVEVPMQRVLRGEARARLVNTIYSICGHRSFE
ncbi:hypothetical protein BDN72DRAFT_632284 [Pluteus cervinus]|uniref:Uncharacterized protein n=1 Tax=Pluteus cervinus TaxID=181527 RepID=A0ACD3BAD1_9AGAR|nr:hypothetical protein BDN72DRAFT_632284 [Pluteus cervinus]